ncbi:MAG: peptidase S15, partial [Chloroflexota bacterium]
MLQWQVAPLKPPPLAAINPWEGFSDWYREFGYHGGILSTYIINWYENRAIIKQNGLGERGYKSRMTGDWVSGPETLSDEALRANR